VTGGKENVNNKREEEIGGKGNVNKRRKKVTGRKRQCEQ
jgi:hypothetical protein